MRVFTRMMGLLLLTIGIAGLLAGETPLSGFLNVDIVMDIVRLGLGALLIFAGFSRNADVSTMRTVLTVMAITFLGITVLGLLSSTLWGMVPNGLSTADIVLHLAGGLAALTFAARSVDNFIPTYR